MVYNEKFVVVVKCNGKILREKDDIVSIPFGSNYSLLFKNLNSTKAQMRVSIDGKDVLDGHALLIEPNSDSELLGFMRGNEVHHKFKFIQKTEEISEFRGDRIDDGIIRVEYRFEEQPKTCIRKSIIDDSHNHHYYYYSPLLLNNIYYSQNEIVGSSAENIIRATSSSVNSVIMDSLSQENDEGITVQGEKTNQYFSYGEIGKVGPSNIIILQLRGHKSDGSEVLKPLTVKTKITCPTCGKKSKSNASYCSNCGTNLEI